MQSDFIIIGSGLAGLTSSLILSKYGKVLMITKGKLSDGATNWAQGGIACAVSKDDSWQSHFEDTLIAGAYHNDKKAVEFLVKNASVAIDWLSKQGVPFEKSNRKYKTGREGGHSFNRILHATDFTGKEIELTLAEKVKKNKNIKIWEYAFAEKLLVEDEVCIGASVISSKARNPAKRSLRSLDLSPRLAGLEMTNRGSKTLNIFARVVILATGGLGQIYQWTTNPTVSTGDGFALAHRAGAKLKDMEFIQFHPTALKHGESPLFLLSEALRGEGAWLVRTKNKEQKTKNKKKERFMGDYDERLELAPRDIVARAIFKEQQNGYEIFLDIRHKGEKFIKKRFPNIYKELKKRRFDLANDLIPVTPAAHYSCGGVETDLYGRTNIKNLFAFGEVAATGVHGANRLASNSLLEAVVFPMQLLKVHGSCRSRVPNSASKSLHFVGLKASEATFGSPSLPSPVVENVILNQMRKKLQQLMWGKVGIVRRKKELEEAREQLKIWEKDLESLDYQSRELLELKNMILVARLIIKAALKRNKSLGSHLIE